MKRIVMLSLSVLISYVSMAAEKDYVKKEAIPYRSDVSPECVLDVAYVPEKTDRPVIVWFHGGGLKKGHRDCPVQLMTEDYVIVGVEYRLYPTVKVKEILRDCAAAVAWVYKNIEQYGGSLSNVFLAGHSAGGYISAMLGLDKSYLAEVGVDADTLAGLGLYSAQVITHFTERSDRGIDRGKPIVDEMAPLYHVRGDCPPVFITTGGRDLEMICRYEENAYFYKILLYNGHKDVVLYEEDGYTHGKMYIPSHPLFLMWVKTRIR